MQNPIRLHISTTHGLGVLGADVMLFDKSPLKYWEGTTDLDGYTSWIVANVIKYRPEGDYDYNLHNAIITKTSTGQSNLIELNTSAEDYSTPAKTFEVEVNTQCFDITTAGSYNINYDIFADIDRCIDIQSSDVILDCATFIVDANGFEYPIWACDLGEGCGGGGVGDYKNITIKNCKVLASKEAIFVNGNNVSIFNNLISSSDHSYVNTTGDISFNTTRQLGDRIFSPGTEIGGNYLTDPLGAGYSDTCADANTDGFCDTPFDFKPQAPVETCSGTASCNFSTSETCTDYTFNPICSWTGSSCQIASCNCSDMENVDNCELPTGYQGCTWDEENGTCSGSCVLDCYVLSMQNECQNQTGCSFGYTTTYSSTVDYLPLSNKADLLFTMRTFDESTGAQIYFTATIVNSTNTTNTGYQFNYEESPNNLPTGSVSVVVSNTTYYQSKYIGTIPTTTDSHLDAYLQPLSNLNVKQVSFLTTSASSQALPGVLVSINRLVNGVSVSVGNVYTDSTGMASFFMDSSISYTVTASMLGYSTVTQTIIPTQSTYTITMGNWTIGMFHQTFYDIQWTFSPTGILDENKTHNLTFSTFSSTGKIVWFAWKIYNGTTLLRFENVTSTTGGTINYLVLPGPNSNITLYFFIMRVNMSEQQLAIWWMPLPVQSFINGIIGDINRFITSNQTLTSVLKNLGNQANNWVAFPKAISSFTLVLGTLIVGVITSAWVGRFSPTGGQLVFVIVMAVGAYMGAGILASISLLIFIIIVAVAYQLWRSGG
jgi:hypothetical protein